MNTVPQRVYRNPQIYPRIRIYILCHNETTYEHACREYGGLEWAVVLQIESTVWLENWMFLEWFPAHEREWNQFDYVGILSWKACYKMPFPDMENVRKALAEEKPDLYAFQKGARGHLVRQAEQCHPGFRPIWLRWTRELYPDTTEDEHHGIRPFYCNYWLARPPVLRAYCLFFKEATTRLSEIEEIQEALWSDSRYKGIPVEACERIFGRPYYPFHVFLCERLPCLWSHRESLKIGYL